ncbi:hypothetical protein OKW21_002395 [Catalinimonas alkaloidigena]|nr:hypothetical protein [Catalinimonas alkaloidigena]
MNISEIFIYLDTISPIVLLLFILFMKSETWGRDYILWYILVQAVLNSVAIVYDQFLIRNNLFLYDLNCILSFVIISLFFHSLFISRKLKFITRLNLIFFIVFFLTNLYWGDGLNTFNSMTYGVSSFIIVVYCFMYYLKKLKNPAASNISKSRFFWYVTGIFTYYSGSFFIFITYSYLTVQKIEGVYLLWQIHNFIFLLMCIYLFIGFLCKPLPENYKL